ncbi:MAG: hypothetical protein IJN19_01190 [Opitutales bacterium]|nr:hypothetical protein [Opitutales bacterium]
MSFLILIALIFVIMIILGIVFGESDNSSRQKRPTGNRREAEEKLEEAMKNLAEKLVELPNDLQEEWLRENINDLEARREIRAKIRQLEKKQKRAEDKFIADMERIFLEHAYPMFIFFVRSDRNFEKVRFEAFKREIVSEDLEDEKKRGKDVDARKRELNAILKEARSVPYGELESELSKNSAAFFSELRKSVKKDSSFRLCIKEVPFAVMNNISAILKNGGKITDKDFRWLDIVAKNFCLDWDEYQLWKEKELPAVLYRSGEVSRRDVEEMLGITPAMSKSEKLSKLNNVYREWNAKKNSQDAGTRAHAQKMVNLIAEMRVELTKN